MSEDCGEGGLGREVTLGIADQLAVEVYNGNMGLEPFYELHLDTKKICTHASMQTLCMRMQREKGRKTHPLP